MIELYGTLGPACADRRTLAKMFEEGMSGMRLNLSHGGLSHSTGMLQEFEAAAKPWPRRRLMIDLQGPELRIGDESSPILLVDKEEFFFSSETFSLPAIVLEVLEKGDELLLDDGRISCTVTGKEVKKTRVMVRTGGMLKARKNIKVVGKDVHGASLTSQDTENIKLAKSFHVNEVMCPFVTTARQLIQTRAALEQHGCGDFRIFAKIENKEGMRHLEEILSLADVIVIARGDLGNDMPLWELPAAQKEIEEKCLAAGKEFLVVTQMLASMTQNPVPTRAELLDIFNAVLDGASALMLTNETAEGKYPDKAMMYLRRTAQEAKKWQKGGINHD